jgi:hypothetical protein
MKTQKLLVMATLVCLLVGASSAAMARNDCPDGFLVGGEYEEIIINENVSCTILGVYVRQGITARNVNDITIKDSFIEGSLRVIGAGTVQIEDNWLAAPGGLNVRLVVANLGVAHVVRNVARIGQIVVVDRVCDSSANNTAEVIQNVAFGGNVKVKCNDSASVLGNYAKDGSIVCNNNVSLIARGNYTEKVNCSASSTAEDQ